MDQCCNPLEQHGCLDSMLTDHFIFVLSSLDKMLNTARKKSGERGRAGGGEVT